MNRIELLSIPLQQGAVAQMTKNKSFCNSSFLWKRTLQNEQVCNSPQIIYIFIKPGDTKRKSEKSEFTVCVLSIVYTYVLTKSENNVIVSNVE